ncbi:MAG: trypsin-like peptidase domain-containing protein [Rhizobiales bacterium]|nr:trypsin-like peptidase domain-containing protein [Hyphomicrobiales bacterium]
MRHIAIRRRSLFAAVSLAAGLWLTPATRAESTCEKNSIAEAFRIAAPSVVRVFSVSIESFDIKERVQMETGAGIVFDGKGNIVTNAHVVYGAKQLLVSVDEQGAFPATIVGADPLSDTAVIKISDGGELNLPPATFGDSRELQIGEEVLAIGYPFEMDKSASRGIISGLNRKVPVTTMSWLTPLIQTDAAVNPGNSGGPLVDLCGRVIGMMTLSGQKADNVAFAIPSGTLSELAPQLISKGRVVRPWHGINGKIVPDLFIAFFDMPAGLMVETVEPGSPAEKISLRGGLLPMTIGSEEYLVGGDIITSVNGHDLATLDDVLSVVHSLKVGDELTVNAWRDGEERTVKVTLPERPVLPGDLIAIGRTGDQRNLE